MPRPHHDPAEIIRSLAAELPRGEREHLLTELLCQSTDLVLLTCARNAVTERTAEIIGERYGNDIIEDLHHERVL